MSDEIKLDVPSFFRRAQSLLDAWENATQHEEYTTLVGVDAVIILVGEPDEDQMYRKSTALQTWLLGYEFPSTLMVFTKNKISFLCSSSKAKILAQLQADHPTPIELEVLIKNNKDPETLKHAPNLVEMIQGSGAGQRIGTLLKETHTGKMVDEWKKAVKASTKKFDEVDISLAIGGVMAPKDAEELKIIEMGCKLSSTMINNYFVDKMVSAIENGKKMTHEGFASMIESKIGNDTKGPDIKNVWSKNPEVADTDFSTVDFVYTPIIQSGGAYDLKASAESDDRDLASKGAVLVSLGIRLKSYCSNMGRTFLIDPQKSQEKNYSFLLDVQKYVIELLVPGVVIKDITAKAQAYVHENRPDLDQYFTKSLGFGTGIEFRDAAYVINAKNGRQVKAGMVFSLSVSFAALPDPVKSSKTYSLQVIDTVRVGESETTILTNGSKAKNDVVFFMNGDEDEEKKSKPKIPSPKKDKISGYQVGNKVLRGKTRGEDKDIDESAQKRMKDHQKELHEQRQEKGLEKYAEEGGDGEEDKSKQIKKFESYKREDQLPREIAKRKIFIDEARQTLILPINGFAAPFHVNTIKNATKSDEGEYTVLRINFQSPGQITGKKEDTPFEDPNASFIRSVVFRSAEHNHIANVCDQISRMRTQMVKRDKEKKELADVITQEKLVEARNKRPHVLMDVLVKPALDGKRGATGDVQIHENGIRYVAHSGQKIDLLFSNIKHLFFQPCDGEPLVIIHVHLKAPIMVGKKKAKDVQFSREASDTAIDETGNKKRKYRYGDEDEIELEQEERRRRLALNKEFKAYAEKIAAASGGDFEVDIPFRELGFLGVPHRSNVFLQPTTDCLIQLSDTPYFVVTLNEVEIVHFERVQHGLKQFDMVFVMQDFTKPPQHINSIPFGALEGIKEWLDSVDIPFSEGAVNLTWPAIMKTINEDPYAFFSEGGWAFLGDGGGDDGGSDASEEESEFEADSDAPPSSDESDSGSDFDEDESDSDASAGSDVSEGMDWDELEKKASRDDDRRRANGNGHDSDDDDRGRKKSSGGGSKSKSNGRR